MASWKGVVPFMAEMFAPPAGGSHRRFAVSDPRFGVGQWFHLKIQTHMNDVVRRDFV